MIGGGFAKTAATVIALSNTTPGAGYSATDTSIGAGTDFLQCGLGIAAGTYVSQSATAAGQWNVTKTFTSTCSNQVTVNATGLYNATGAGSTLFAETNFTSTNLNQNDQINVTWGISIS